MASLRLLTAPLRSMKPICPRHPEAASISVIARPKAVAIHRHLLELPLKDAFVQIYPAGIQAVNEGKLFCSRSGLKLLFTAYGIQHG